MILCCINLIITALTSASHYFVYCTFREREFACSSITAFFSTWFWARSCQKQTETCDTCMWLTALSLKKKKCKRNSLLVFSAESPTAPMRKKYWCLVVCVLIIHYEVLTQKHSKSSAIAVCQRGALSALFNADWSQLNRKQCTLPHCCQLTEKQRARSDHKRKHGQVLLGFNKSHIEE